jgi:hypothetical protein
MMLMTKQRGLTDKRTAQEGGRAQQIIHGKIGMRLIGGQRMQYRDELARELAKVKDRFSTEVAKAM